MSGSCSYPGCTVDDTGSCALERPPLSCSNRVTNQSGMDSLTDEDDEGEDKIDTSGLGAAVLDQPVRGSVLPSSRALGLDALNVLMGSRYVNVVGILGDPESGKTACLASLYLLVSHAKLDGWSFADSKSLSAFEDIARGARDWNDGTAPEQMTVHTELADDNGPGFLHLKLVRASDGRRFDLALPDIPGEWTQALVSTGRSDRLDYMKSAEAIWVVLDGRALADIEKRHGVITRVGQLAQRLHTMMDGRPPRLLIVVTHRDVHDLDDAVVNRLQTELGRRGASAEVVGIAPFSDRPGEVPAGFGLANLIDRTVATTNKRPVFWPSTESPAGSRAFVRYRRNQ
ncbi:hypothetical protein GIV20_25365 [Pseudomonas tremae]|nr:hypothetical protein [Pseudomonas tremae]MCF5811345.1 hypothetical protein [Pseudomonas tremae]